MLQFTLAMKGMVRFTDQQLAHPGAADGDAGALTSVQNSAEVTSSSIFLPEKVSRRWRFMAAGAEIYFV
jgi:hypothetical protein